LKALIADDEPHYLDWIEDYLEPKGISVDFVTTIEAAVEALSEFSYRFILIDLNIPLSSDFVGVASATEPWFQRFPGLYIAYIARNSGYRSRQVIIYSVHLEEAVREYVESIRCEHIPKGWPQDLKREIDHLLEFDPSQNGL
jgi:CheY-like chemotaxis protein